MSEKIILSTARFTVVNKEYVQREGNSVDKAIVRHPGAVAIVPLVDDKTICLIRNFRVAVDRELIELPAGTREPNETPLETAHRELEEETGYVANKLTHLHTLVVSPGILDERIDLYVAQDLTYSSPAREPGEQIENYLVSIDEAMQLMRDGKIQDSKTISGLMLFKEFFGTDN